MGLSAILIRTRPVMKLMLILKLWHILTTDADEPEDKKVTLPSLFPPGKINGIEDLSQATKQLSSGSKLMLLPERN